MQYLPHHKPRTFSRAEYGLTLVEMLVVAPLIILIIGTMIGFMTSITGDGLVRAKTNSTIYNVQSALDSIEQDVLSTDAFLTTTGPLASPQGSGGGTTAFVTPSSGTTSSVLILKTPAVQGNRLSESREILRKNAPEWCGTSSEYLNDYLGVTVVYFVSGGSLWKRTIINAAELSATCNSSKISQKNSCAAAGVGTGACVVTDEQLLDSASGFTVRFYPTSSSTSPIATSDLSTANVVTVQLNSSSQVAGKTITYSGTIKATK